jgi:hypothetical protein
VIFLDGRPELPDRPPAGALACVPRRRRLGVMTEEEHDEVEDVDVQCTDLDAGGGSECLELGSDWVAYLAEVDLPSNVTGVDYDIADFEGQEWANV